MGEFYSDVWNGGSLNYVLVYITLAALMEDSEQEQTVAREGCAF